MRAFGEHPRVCDFITELINWRREQNRGMGEIPITQWMAECLEKEMGGEVKCIDEVPLRVVPNSDCLNVGLGLRMEEV